MKPTPLLKRDQTRICEFYDSMKQANGRRKSPEDPQELSHWELQANRRHLAPKAEPPRATPSKRLPTAAETECAAVRGPRVTPPPSISING